MLICRGKLLHNKTIDALSEEFGCERSTVSKIVKHKDKLIDALENNENKFKSRLQKANFI